MERWPSTMGCKQKSDSQIMVDGQQISKLLGRCLSRENGKTTAATYKLKTYTALFSNKIMQIREF